MWVLNPALLLKHQITRFCSNFFVSKSWEFPALNTTHLSVLSEIWEYMRHFEKSGDRHQIKIQCKIGTTFNPSASHIPGTIQYPVYFKRKNFCECQNSRNYWHKHLRIRQEYLFREHKLSLAYFREVNGKMKIPLIFLKINTFRKHKFSWIA